MCYLLSCVQLFVIPWTGDCQAPKSMELSRQAYWSGLPCPSGIEAGSPTLQADSLPSRPPGKLGMIECWGVWEKENKP